jgi:hypothetical protein
MREPTSPWIIATLGLWAFAVSVSGGEGSVAGTWAAICVVPIFGFVQIAQRRGGTGRIHGAGRISRAAARSGNDRQLAQILASRDLHGRDGRGTAVTRLKRNTGMRGASHRLKSVWIIKARRYWLWGATGQTVKTDNGTTTGRALQRPNRCPGRALLPVWLLKGRLLRLKTRPNRLKARPNRLKAPLRRRQSTTEHRPTAVHSCARAALPAEARGLHPSGPHRLPGPHCRNPSGGTTTCSVGGFSSLSRPPQP